MAMKINNQNNQIKQGGSSLKEQAAQLLNDRADSSKVLRGSLDKFSAANSITKPEDINKINGDIALLAAQQLGGRGNQVFVMA